MSSGYQIGDRPQSKRTADSQPFAQFEGRFFRPFNVLLCITEGVKQRVQAVY